MRTRVCVCVRARVYVRVYMVGSFTCGFIHVCVCVCVPVFKQGSNICVHVCVYVCVLCVRV